MNLNKKRAELAGFEYKEFPIFADNSNTPSEYEHHWVAPNGEVRGYGHPYPVPNFTESLDACFKWLVPKAIDEIMSRRECSSDLAYAVLFKKWLQELELDIPKHAHTLCKAIEKLLEEK